MYYEINETIARSAKQANSMSDYVNGSATQEYKNACDEVIALGERCKSSSYEPDAIDRLVESFCRKYADWINRYNSNRASCPSILMSGGSNFPVAKKEKQNAREGRLWEEYNQIVDIKNKIASVGTTIKSDNPQAVEILTKKLEELKAKQAQMKAVNKHYRKYKTCVGAEGLTDEKAAELDESMKTAYSWESAPYASFTLTNLNQRIKTAQERVDRITKIQEVAKTTPTMEDVINGVRVVRNFELDRLQLIFDGKPSDDIRTKLKSHGFRWSPNNGAWQRQLTQNARYDARKILSGATYE